MENRVVVTSTNDKSLTWQIVYSSFADKFLWQIDSGSSVGEAFQIAATIILNDDLFGGQRPWLDDDGDGQFFNDGALAANIYLGGEGFIQTPPPAITQVHPHKTLAENDSSATLWVKTSPSGSTAKLYKVQAVLVNPNFVLSDYQGEATNFDRFEAVYDKFCTAGLWRIFYQAQDTDGVWSEIATGEVQAQGCSLPATVKMDMNQSRYTTTEPLRLDMTVNGQAVVDLYVAIVFPAGYFQTIA
ncbi:hypothetical protein THIOM_004398 [Candidatus Thiomargarita nelsonii]|uniref:Uncharacterized protein n=1 Tax=Candidatus Thiomargarita nelsonii TaxID=1003181 RepID=A0A176RW45_9GAMM|nr:hypothetical protein THIOM_004398 [Candidatus Thiomargarita nelsonii]